MTLLVALQGKDGIVLAADSRGTFGDPREVTAQNDSQQKAHVLSQHVAVLQAGAAELAATILGRTRDVLAGGLLLQQLPGNAAPTILHAPEPPLPRPDFVLPSTPDGVTPVMETLRQTSRASYYEWFPSVPAMQAPGLAAAGQAPVRPDVQLLVAGYEIEPGITDPVPRLYSMTSQWDFVLGKARLRLCSRRHTYVRPLPPEQAVPRRPIARRAYGTRRVHHHRDGKSGRQGWWASASCSNHIPRWLLAAGCVSGSTNSGRE